MNTTLTLTPSMLPTLTSFTVTPVCNIPSITFVPSSRTFVKNGATSQTVIVKIPSGITASTASINLVFGGNEGNQYTYSSPGSLVMNFLGQAIVTVPTTTTTSDIWAGQSSLLDITISRLPVYQSVTLKPTTGLSGICLLYIRLICLTHLLF
jgi:hypothetical protein